VTSKKEFYEVLVKWITIYIFTIRVTEEQLQTIETLLHHNNWDFETSFIDNQPWPWVLIILIKPYMYVQ